MMDRPRSPEARPVTGGPRFHFFGYYDKTPWDTSGTRLLCLESTFMDRRPVPDDVAAVGYADLADGCRFVPVGETRAWNWQQGCMLQWVPGSDDEIVFNDRDGGRFVARVLNVRTRASRTLPLPVYGLSPNGRDAVSLNFSRLFDLRPGYGYAGVPDAGADDPCPADDGVWHLDLATGAYRLLFSLRDARALAGPGGAVEDGPKDRHRFNHAQWAPDGSRFAVLHRWGPPGGRWRTRLLTFGPGGEDPFVLSDHEMVSHYDWRDGSHLLAWARRQEVGDRYFLFADRSDAMPVVIGEGALTVDGHCSYSPDRRWILTDTYPDREGFRTLLLFDPRSGRRVDIGRFHGPTPPDGEIRCDLHPRWNRDGTAVCIDSIHDGGARQVYVIDVSEVTK